MNKPTIERLMQFSREAAAAKRTTEGGSDQRMVRARRYRPHTCGYCRHFNSESGWWECAEDPERAPGDTGEGYQHETTCERWKRPNTEAQATADAELNQHTK